MRRRIRLALVALVVPLGIGVETTHAESQAKNLIANGGFEEGTEGWSWGEWKGLPEPGFLDTNAPFKGRASYVISMAGIEGSRFLAYSVKHITPTNDYELSLALRGNGLPQNCIGISLLQWGTEKGKKVRPQGWITLPGRGGVRELLVVGGTFGWKKFKVHIYRQGIKPTTNKLTLFIEHTAIGQGELSIDEVSLMPVKPVAYKRPSRPKNLPTLARRTPNPARKKPAAAEPKRGGREGKDILLDRCDSATRWGTVSYPMDGGGKSEVMIERDNGLDVLKVTYDFSQAERNHQISARSWLRIKQAQAILFDIRSTNQEQFHINIMDARRQQHQARFAVRPGRWETIAIPLTLERFTCHWTGGANADGQIHFPLKAIMIGTTAPKGARDSFLLRDLGVRQAATGNTWQVIVTTDRPGHIHFVNEPNIQVTIKVLNSLRRMRSTPVHISIVDMDGKVLATESRTIAFGPWSSQVIDMSLDTPDPGYFPVKVTIGEGAQQEHALGAFAVVPRPVRYGQHDPDSFFAMHVNADPWIAARIGVHWSRHFHFWRYTESQQGVYTHNVDYLKQCMEAGIDVMWLLDYREPAWLKPKTGPDGLPTREALRAYAAWVRDAVRAHQGASAFEIQNEPDLELMAHRNLSLEKGVEFYTRLVKTAAPIIREETPGVPIVGCNVSGQDQKQGFPFSRAVFNRVGDLFDVWAPHPYASPRCFGPGLAPLSPEGNRETQKHHEALALIRQVDKGHRYWIGEKGWQIKHSETLTSRNSLSFANYCARSLIIAKSVPDVERYFWFLLQHESAKDDGLYALFRGTPLQPTPAAAAYANVAYRLDHARPVESLQFAGGNIRICVFDRPMTNAAIAALWTIGTSFTFEPALPDDAHVSDLYGREIRGPSFTLTETPIFIQAPASKKGTLISALKAARFHAAQPFEVTAAFLADVHTLRIGLRNNSSGVVRVEGRAAGQNARIALLPSQEDISWLHIRLPTPVTKRKRRPLPLVLSPRVGKPIQLSISTDLLPVVHRVGITIDGRTEDWKGIRPIVLDKRKQVFPPDEAGWNGPDDLSIRILSAWDEANLYLLVCVTDDIHMPKGPGHFWKKDALQIALDMMNDATAAPGFDGNDREYGVLIDKSGAHTFQTHPRAQKADFQAAGRRTGKETVYEIALPWSKLGREPSVGMIFSLNLVAIDNDGAGANYWMGLTPGIVEGKRPGLYRNFYLITPISTSSRMRR